MATNIIYKGELNGTQVDFSTGNLTDISTFDTDVRSSAIQNSISSSETAIGASQAAIWSMSGYLAANAHPDVTPASNISIDNSNGTVLQDASFTFDADGHVTAASFVSANLDDRYYTESEVDAKTGVLLGYIYSNDGDISNLVGATGTLNTRLTSAELDIDALQAASGNYLSLTLDNVCDNNATTDQDIQVNDIRVDGGTITGPATLTIDPDSVGAAGTVVIQGNLDVRGTTTTVHSTEVNIGDKSLVLGTGAANDAAMDGGGIVLSGTAGSVAEFTYDSATDRWASSLDIAADLIGNASTAFTWETARTITLSGDLGGNTSINGSADVTLNATIQNGSVENDMLAGSISNDKLSNSTIGVVAGSGLAGGGTPALGGSTTLNIGGGDGITVTADAISVNAASTQFAFSSQELYIKANAITSQELANEAVDSGAIQTDAVGPIHLHDSIAGDNLTITDGILSVADSDIVAAITGGASSIATTNLTANRVLVSDSSGKVAFSATISSSELNALDNISSNIQNQLDGKALKATTMTASNGLSGGGDLSANRTFATVSDQGHLDEIELGSDDTSISNVVTKGGILILRGTDSNGITTSGADGNAIALNDKTTVAFEGVVQSADTAQDNDNGSYVAMWKIQGVIRRDADSTNMLQSFVTKTFAGSNASAYGIDVAVDGNGLKISSDQATATLITSATINYNWIEETV